MSDNHRSVRKFFLLAAVAMGLLVAVASVLLVRTLPSATPPPAGTLQCASTPVLPQPGDASVTQCSYVISIENGRKVLTAGFVTYVSSVSTDIGHSVEFTATVCGAAASRCRAPSSVNTSTTRPSTTQTPIQVGGNIRARLTSDMPDAQGQITLESSEDQPVVESTDAASWTWRIQPSSPGDFDLIVSFTVLLGSSSSSLTPDMSYHASLTVRQTTSHAIGSWWQSFGDFIKSLGGILSALGVSVAAVVLWIVRRTKKTPADVAEPRTSSKRASETTSRPKARGIRRPPAGTPKK